MFSLTVTSLLPKEQPRTVRVARPVHWRNVAIFTVKLVHSAIFLSVAASILYVFYAGVTNQNSRTAQVALGTALTESLIFAVNRFRCPLRTLAEDLGADSGQVTDIFLPKWFADRIPFIFTPLLVIGMVAMLRNRGRGSRYRPYR